MDDDGDEDDVSSLEGETLLVSLDDSDIDDESLREDDDETERVVDELIDADPDAVMDVEGPFDDVSDVDAPNDADAADVTDTDPDAFIDVGFADLDFELELELELDGDWDWTDDDRD